MSKLRLFIAVLASLLAPAVAVAGTKLQSQDFVSPLVLPGALSATSITGTSVTSSGDLSASSAAVTGDFFSVGGGTLVVKNGRIGIFNANPLTLLHIGVGNAALNDGPLSTLMTLQSNFGNTGIEIGGGAGGAQMHWYAGSAGGILGTVGSFPLYFSTDNTSRLALLQTSGFFGVGTLTPQTLLDVAGAAQFGSGVNKSTFTASGGAQIRYGVQASTFAATGGTVGVGLAPDFVGRDADSGLQLGGSGFATDSLVYIRNGVGSWEMAGNIFQSYLGSPIIRNKSGSGSLRLDSANGIALSTSTNSGTTNAFLSSSGNLGVGTTSPTSLFSVGPASEFQANSSGDLVKIRNVTYSWPSSQGAVNQVLTNNGSGTLTWTTPAASGSAVVTKYTVAFGALSAASTTNDIELFSLPAKGMVKSVIIKPTTAFSGGAISAYTISIGTGTLAGGTLARYASAFNVFQAVDDQTFQSSNVGLLENFGSAVSVRIAATSTGANLSAAAAGSVDVYVETVTLP